MTNLNLTKLLNSFNAFQKAGTQEQYQEISNLLKKYSFSYLGFDEVLKFEIKNFGTVKIKEDGKIGYETACLDGKDLNDLINQVEKIKQDLIKIQEEISF